MLAVRGCRLWDVCGLSHSNPRLRLLFVSSFSLLGPRNLVLLLFFKQLPSITCSAQALDPGPGSSYILQALCPSALPPINQSIHQLQKLHRYVKESFSFLESCFWHH